VVEEAIVTTELVAVDPVGVASALPQGSGITIFDWSPILGVPAWLFIDCILLFGVLAIFIYWIAKIRKLSAVRGWADSLKNMDVNDVQVWMISRTQKLVIGCMKIEDNVLSYHDPSKIGMWHHNTRESVIRVGGNPAVVVSEDFDQTRDIISEIALTDNCDVFNENQGALKEWNEKQNDDSAVIEPINDYDDYESHGREALQIVNPDGLPMRSWNIFSNIRFLKYFPHGCSHMFFGGELRFDAIELKPNQSTKGFWEKHAFIILAAIIALAGICAAWFVPLKVGG
jgi:hypothetical protein